MNKLQETYRAQIEELVAASNRLAQIGFVTSQGGNLSYRVAEDVILITPTKVAGLVVCMAGLYLLNR